MAKYINTAMAIEALEKGLNVWIWAPSDKRWDISGLSSLTQKDCGHRHFAIGEKPTSPPRKTIEIDGVRMPAPIFGRDEAGPDLCAFVLRWDKVICCSALSDMAIASYAYGDVFATRLKKRTFNRVFWSCCNCALRCRSVDSSANHRPSSAVTRSGIGCNALLELMHEEQHAN